jgi:hypothetical protein
MRGGVPLLSAMLCAIVAPGLAFGAEQPTTEIVIDMEEVSTFDIVDEADDFARGQYVLCNQKGGSRAETCPPLHSDEPIYGSLSVNSAGGKTDNRQSYKFVIDARDGQTYDCMYFDLNRDQDLTNDTPLMAQKVPPDGARLNYSSITQQVCFDCVVVPVGDEAHPVEVMPRLVVNDGGYKSLVFVATKARKGQFEMGGRRYTVYLGNDRAIRWPLNQPDTGLHLFPESQGARGISWWGGDRMKALHELDGNLYRFSATPSGDKLTMRPYNGEYGTLEVCAGGRDLKTMNASGALASEAGNVAMGKMGDSGRPDPVSACQLPVGDYYPVYLRLIYGGLDIFISNNYHGDGQARMGGQPKYPIHIRKDESFVLDFSDEPEVIFASPASDQRVRAGDTLDVKAVLVDPELDVMFRDIKDTTRAREREVSVGNGQTRTRKEKVPLDPKVLIVRANGERVAEGVMPYG